MSIIKLEDAPVEAVQHVLFTFKNLVNFFPKDKNAEILISKMDNNDFILTEEDKKSTVDIIYKTVRNLISTHLNKNLDYLDSHPDMNQNKKINEIFNEEKEFLNNFSMLTMNVAEDNFIHYNDDKILIEKEKIIDPKLIDKVNLKFDELFNKQLHALKYHVMFDTLIYQINNKNDTFNILKNKGLDFIEEKNFVNNKKELSLDYLTNINKTMEHFQFSNEEKINTLGVVHDFLEKNYVKDNKDELCEFLNKTQGQLFSLPNAIHNYHEQFPENKIKNVDWDSFFSYATSEQLNEAFYSLIESGSLNDDLKEAKKEGVDDFYNHFSERQDFMLGKIFKSIMDQRIDKDKFPAIISDIERIIYEKTEFNNMPKINKNKPVKLKM